MTEDSNSVDILGSWWLPDDASNRWTGHLQFDSRNLMFRLELFRGDSSAPLPDHWQVSSIHGEGFDGMALTLFDCIPLASQERYDHEGQAFVWQTSYWGHYLLTGIPVKSITETGFRGVNAEPTHLRIWSAKKGVIVETMREETGFDIAIRPPLPQSFALGSGLKMSLWVGYTYHDKSFTGEVNLQLAPNVALYSEGSLSLQDCLGWLRIIRDFLRVVRVVSSACSLSR